VLSAGRRIFEDIYVEVPLPSPGIPRHNIRYDGLRKGCAQPWNTSNNVTTTIVAGVSKLFKAAYIVGASMTASSRTTPSTLYSTYA